MATQSKTLIKSRSRAFNRQKGRCYYCGYPMWSSAVESFSLMHKITIEQAKPLQCTAEHLIPRQDGGKDGVDNIAAACLACNQRRHQVKDVLNPKDYRVFVRKHVRRGAWHLMNIFGNR